MKRRGFRSVVVVALLGAGACAGTAPSPFKTAQLRQPIVLNIENNNWSDAVVHIVVLGSRRRLTQVGSMTSSEIVIPRARIPASRTMQILVTFTGSSARFETGNLYVQPGDKIYLRIEKDLNISSWSVR